MAKLRFFLFYCLSALFISHADAQAPVADFSATTTAGCGPLVVGFKDQSSGNPTSWTWDFGNGSISSQQNPSISYSSPGTYTVTLIVKNGSGANSVMKTDYITVYPFPAAAFTADLNVACAPASVQFTDHSTPGQGSITQWKWDFGDGTTWNSQNPSHVFTQTGYYSIGLEVTNSGGCSNGITANRYIRVVAGIQPDFSWQQASSSCKAPFDVAFTNQTSGPGTLAYAWNLGNGVGSSVKDPTTTYPNSQDYTVSLTATSNLGCKASTTKIVNFQARQAVIAVADSSCVNTPVSFSNASTPQPVSSAWTFGDGSSASVANPSKTYSSTGSYTVTLVNNYGSCTASASKTIKIVNTPAINFTADKTAACKSPFTVSFTDQTPGAISWRWDFGDGSSSTDQNPAHTYTSSGSFDVSLTTTSATGCNGTNIKPGFIKIVPPTAAIDLNSIQGCINTAIHPAPVINAIDGVQGYQWSAPGATPSSSTAANPSFVYSTEGNYNLTLTVTSNGGCSASGSVTGQVLIGNPVTPVVNVTPTVSCAHQPITFTSATVGTVDFWRWNFGDNSTSSSDPPVQHAYHDSGYFNLYVYANHHGCAQAVTLTNAVYINAPIAGFRYLVSCANPYQVSFTDTSKFPVGLSSVSKWDFGDGSPIDNSINPSPHTYPALSSYTVTHIIDASAGGGCADTVRTQVNLTKITAAFTVKDTVCREAPFTLTSTSTPASSIDSLSWQILPSPGTPWSDSNTYTTSLHDTGAYTLYLHVKDHSGCTYTSAPAIIHVSGPSAKFTTAAGGCRNSPITFTDNSVPYPGYALSSWTMDYGDGNTQTYGSATPPFTHSYADTGSYTVKLQVKDIAGCTDTFSIISATRITAPRTGFHATDTLYCPGAALAFTDSSQGNNLVYSWDFGDGTTGVTGQNPTHAYPAPPQYYSVKLKITDDAGCSDSLTRINYIHIQKPIAAFDMQDSTGICYPLQTTFLPAGQYYDSLYWDFGDGGTSTLDTTTHFYNNYGTYHPKLILQGAGGCRDTATRNVYVYLPVGADLLNGAKLKACDSVHAVFTLTPLPYTKFTLYFGDGTADSSGNLAPQHDYRYPSTYIPQLSMQDSSGCLSAVNNGSITVLGAVPIYTPDKKAFCDSGTVFFSGTVISNDPPFTVAWDFGDGSSGPGRPNDINQDTTHFYNGPGIRIASLKINTANSCNEAYTDTIRIWQTPHPQIDIDGTHCTGPIQFQGSLRTPDTDSLIWAWTFSDGQKSGIQNPALTFASGYLTAHLQTSVAYGCKDTISATALIQPLPEIKGPAEITTPVGVPVTIPFTYIGGVDSWTWTPAANLSCTDCGNPSASPVFATVYTVAVTDTNHCSSTDSILVKTICNAENYFIPNTFSPNNDGVNDVFYPRGVSLYNIQSMRVFNRWGQLVFERKNFPANTASMGWDGTFNGRAAPSDAYVYMIDVICNNAQIISLKGDITLIR